jgi:hypothetical protein
VRPRMRLLGMRSWTSEADSGHVSGFPVGGRAGLVPMFGDRRAVHWCRGVTPCGASSFNLCQVCTVLSKEPPPPQPTERSEVENDRNLGVPAGFMRAVGAVAALAVAGGSLSGVVEAVAYRPFDGTDAAVADTGEIEIEHQPPRCLPPAPTSTAKRSYDRTTGAVLRGTESLLTHRWRGTDSNLRFRDALAPPTARPWCDAA